MTSKQSVAVIGAGMHPWGKWGRNFVEYGVVAARAALDDAGIAWTDVDFVAGADTIRNGYPGFIAGATFAQALGWSGARVSSSYAACASGVQAIASARAQILAGLSEVALVVGADTTPKGFFKPVGRLAGRGLRPVERARARLVRGHRSVRGRRGRAPAPLGGDHPRWPRAGEPVGRPVELRRGHPSPGHRPGGRVHLAAAWAGRRPPSRGGEGGGDRQPGALRPRLLGRAQPLNHPGSRRVHWMQAGGFGARTHAA